MKKKICKFMYIISICVFLSSCVTKESNLLKSSENIVQNICKNQNNLSEELFGIKYEMNHNQTLDELSSVLQGIEDFTLDHKESNTDRLFYYYNIKTQTVSYEVVILWEKQPDEWLVSKIDWHEIVPNNVYGYDIDQELIDKVLLIVHALAEKDYETIYKHTSKEFGLLAGIFVENLQDLNVYLEDEFYFLNPRYLTFDIEHWSIENQTKNNAVLVAVNKGLPGEFHLNVLLDQNNKMTGIYCIEMETAKADIVFYLPNNESLI